MRFLKEHYKKVCLVIILLIALICTCPIPRHISYKAGGWQLDMAEEDMYRDSAEISLKGWYFQFLFLRDLMNVSVDIHSADEDYQFKIERAHPIIYLQTNGLTQAFVASAYWDGSSFRRVIVRSIEPWKDAIIEIEREDEIFDVFAASESNGSTFTQLVDDYKRQNG